MDGELELLISEKGFGTNKFQLRLVRRHGDVLSITILGMSRDAGKCLTTRSLRRMGNPNL